MHNQPIYYDIHKHCVYTLVVNAKGSLIVKAFSLLILGGVSAKHKYKIQQ